MLNARGEFHGYAGRDFYKVDPHWGTLADLQHMIRAAHARGILVIDDMVVNHGGDLVDSGDPGYPNFKYPPGRLHTCACAIPTEQYPPPFDLNATNTTLSDSLPQQRLHPGLQGCDPGRAGRAERVG